MRLTLRLVGSLMSGVGGEAIGGMPGATYTAITSFALACAEEWDRKSAQQADEVLVDAQQSTGITPEELAAWAQSDEHLRLMVGVVEASFRTRDRDKLRALSRVLAEGITD